MIALQSSGFWFTMPLVISVIANVALIISNITLARALYRTRRKRSVI